MEKYGVEIDRDTNVQEKHAFTKQGMCPHNNTVNDGIEVKFCNDCKKYLRLDITKEDTDGMGQERRQ